MTPRGGVWTLPVTVSGHFGVRAATHGAELSPRARGVALERAEVGTAVPTPAPRCKTEPQPRLQSRTHAGPRPAPGLPWSLGRKARCPHAPGGGPVPAESDPMPRCPGFCSETVPTHTGPGPSCPQ